MVLAVYGIGISRGIAIGKAHVAHRNRLEISEHHIPQERVDQEVQRFSDAVEQAKQALRQVRDRIAATTPTEIQEFVDTHVLMLEDSALTEAPAQIIRELSCNAEWALQVQRNRLAAVFDDMYDPYLASRVNDIDQVISRIQRKLLEHPEVTGEHAEPGSYRGIVLVADDIAPADLALLHHEGIAAVVTEFGGPLSHTAILARGLKIPTVMGVKHARQLLSESEMLIVDGERGCVMAQADADLAHHYSDKVEQEQRRQRQLKRLRNQAAHTRDGHQITLQANVDLPEDLHLIQDRGAVGVGLYRTEYLFLNRTHPPSEQEQFEAYLSVAQAMRGQAVTIRTLDLGADKQLDALKQPGQVSTNPAMGLRAIRLCLAEQDLFIPQLRAIIRVAQHSPVRVLIPMLCNIDEVAQVRRLYQQALIALQQQGVEPKYPIQLGGMIEIPAAALAAKAFAKRLDFLSIGTNDLIQYTLAIDRIDDQVGYLYDPLHPAVLTLIDLTIRAANSQGTPISMCGEMAGDPTFTRLLLAMGLRDLSMHPESLLEVKQIIRNTDLSSLRPLARRLLKADQPERISALLQQLNQH